jgi:hypothetical protein
MKYQSEKEIEGHWVKVTGSLLVRFLFMWAYKRLDEIIFFDEDHFPILEIRKLNTK